MAKQSTRTTTHSSTTQQTTATLYYAYDPMCSWCWAFRPLWDALQAALPNNVNVVYLAGGLAPDSDQPMPLEQQHAIQGYWHEIHRQLGTEFNFDFWQLNTPRRSTYMSCRAAIAAANQNAQPEMIDAIQKAYYLRALNPSDIPILSQLAEELGLDVIQFERDLHSADTQQEFERQMALARRLPIDGFPSLVLEQGSQQVKLQREYRDYRVVLEQVLGLLKSVD